MTMMERDILCVPAAVPAGLADAVAGYRWARDQVGESGGAVYRLSGKADAPDLFLKQGQGSVADDIVDEMVRLRWLAGKVPVPRLVGFVATADDAWLLTTALAGETAWQLLDRAPEQREPVVDALAALLQQLHALPVAACPFDSGFERRLRLARQRIDAGLVDADDFDEQRAGWSAEQVWDALQRHRPLTPDPVVTHGDFSLDNILLREGRVTGCIDLGRVGVADRYQDLAILSANLAEFDDALPQRLFARYGIDTIDTAKVEAHLLLDELF
ncbi:MULTISPECIES: APH(3')-I family aminoglycoside O-phosphotransferase [unclassified Sphingomonas]|uniref:APH(3')-I family aminoglycoside O-phosphotransferase n=1 Tax=unclassified Sphingomonas TaxID=196159 RepID=UPI0006F430FD|nr:aminoglycoside phosphotransferase [Sphingomonas sp. Leaf9]KQM42606.1 aminoglycoside phosphotransferase [Sphingomonas sp. Leaf11]